MPTAEAVGIAGPSGPPLPVRTGQAAGADEIGLGPLFIPGHIPMLGRVQER